MPGSLGGCMWVFGFRKRGGLGKVLRTLCDQEIKLDRSWGEQSGPSEKKLPSGEEHVPTLEFEVVERRKKG